MSIVDQRTLATLASAERLELQVARLVTELHDLARAQAAEVCGVCIGFPGVVHPVTQQIRQAPNVDGAEGRGLQQALQDALGLPVYLENDVNLAALAEMQARASCPPQGLAFLSVGTGLGAGVVVHGSLWQGRDGGAGEVCSLSPSPQGLQILRQVAPTLQAPTVEDLVSGKGLARLYQTLRAAAGGPQAQVPFDYRQLPQLFAQAESGDAVAAESIHIVAQELAHVVLQLEHVMNLELYVLDGGLGARPELRAQVNQALQAHGLQVQASRFGGASPAPQWATPGQAGAALLAHARWLAPVRNHNP
jgi:predicted NBD/HSP70 family sugar kinase